MPAAAFTRTLSPARQSVSALAPSPPQLPSIPSKPVTQEDRKKEAERIAKWGRMLVPAARDSGANVAKWTIDRRKERKLVPRVYKGIPDRWRAAAWCTLMERMAGPTATKEDALATRYRVCIQGFREIGD